MYADPHTWISSLSYQWSSLLCDLLSPKGIGGIAWTPNILILIGDATHNCRVLALTRCLTAIWLLSARFNPMPYNCLWNEDLRRLSFVGGTNQRRSACIMLLCTRMSASMVCWSWCLLVFVILISPSMLCTSLTSKGRLCN